MATLFESVKTVASAANSGTYLSDSLRDAMRVTAQASKTLLDDDKYLSDTGPLKDLIHHMMIHSGYSRNGYNKMTKKQRDLYDAIASEMFGE